MHNFYRYCLENDYYILHFMNILQDFLTYYKLHFISNKNVKPIKKAKYNNKGDNVIYKELFFLSHYDKIYLLEQIFRFYCL